MNRALTVAHGIAIERNLLLCLQVWFYIFILSLFYPDFFEYTLGTELEFYVDTSLCELAESGCWWIVGNISHW